MIISFMKTQIGCLPVPAAWCQGELNKGKWCLPALVLDRTALLAFTPKTDNPVLPCLSLDAFQAAAPELELRAMCPSASKSACGPLNRDIWDSRSPLS